MGDLTVLRLIMDTGVTDSGSSFQPNTAILTIITTYSISYFIIKETLVMIAQMISHSQNKANTALRRAFLLYYKEKKPLCGQKIQD